MRHRAQEIAAIAAILQDETFETETDMAKAIIEEVYKLFKLRTWFGVKWGGLAYGPYIDKGEANRNAALLDNLPTVHEMLRAADLDRVVQRTLFPRLKRKCDACDHPAFAHGFSNHLGCVVRRCPCKLSFK